MTRISDCCIAAKNAKAPSAAKAGYCPGRRGVYTPHAIRERLKTRGFIGEGFREKILGGGRDGCLAVQHRFGMASSDRDGGCNRPRSRIRSGAQFLPGPAR